MKDIFFRGKPKNADDYEVIKKAFPNKCKDGFVYGYPLYDERTNRWFICVSGVCKLNCIIDNSHATVIEVVPETIGQYTGLTDGKGTRIFEGDIIQSIESSEKGEIQYFPEHTAFLIFVRKSIIRGSNNCYLDYLGEVEPSILKVIGNIFDNSELLEGKKKQMTINDYQKEALRTEAGADNSYPRILNGLMGLNGEAGEAIDILKKHLFQGHELDKEHLAKELGDIAWYLAVSADAIGYDLEKIFQMNVDKLRKRYPDGFKKELSINRDGNDI